MYVLVLLALVALPIVAPVIVTLKLEALEKLWKSK